MTWLVCARWPPCSREKALSVPPDDQRDILAGTDQAADLGVVHHHEGIRTWSAAVPHGVGEVAA
jgi:hypothetical protein